VSAREGAGQRARDFFEGLWQLPDPWDFEGSAYERERMARLFAMIQGRRYGRILELGCGSGHFTGLLAPIADRIVALDIAPAAIERARARGLDRTAVDFRVANIMEYKPASDGPWDLVVMTETICYLGWLYSFFEVAWLAAEIFAATRPGGRLLLANTLGEGNEALLQPWVIRTYHDLFGNVGYRREAEELSRGVKHGVDFEVLSTLFIR
jgi:SAM-dependent methyltransferase